MESYQSKQAYFDALLSRAELPIGFRTATTSFHFFPSEIGGSKQYPMNLSLILLDKPTDSFHALFTKNLFCGAPITIGRNRLKEKLCRGILVNNKISNVAAPGGEADAETVLRTLASSLGENAHQFFPASTGIIGWKLPVREMCDNIPPLLDRLDNGPLVPVAQAIMTTDSYPKIRSAACGEGRIVAIAKGAGMIEPNMGTMLVFILTDIDVSRGLLADCLFRAAEESLNRISIDGDQSTSDMAIMLSSRQQPFDAKRQDFYETLRGVLQSLSDDIVRNGEGVSHVIKVTVERAPSVKIALEAGKAIVNSPLVKSAVFGNDPNVGRIIGALGDYFGNHGLKIRRDLVTVTMGGIPLFHDNQFQLDGEKEKKLSAYLSACAYSLGDRFPPHHRSVEITVQLHAGRHVATVLGADLTYEYVKENAAYRS